VESGRLAHVVTLNPDGSPQVSCVWIAMDGDELVMMHTADHVTVRNLRRDPRVVVLIESEERSEGGPIPIPVLSGGLRYGRDQRWRLIRLARR
jgi:PPOX class probable F420-dependent enzyme